MSLPASDGSGAIASISHLLVTAGSTNEGHMSNDGTNTPPPQDNPYGSPPSYGQPSYGQPNYGQPNYGQPNYGQPTGGPIEQPGSIKLAVQLMRAGAVLSLLGLLTTFFVQDQIRDEVESSMGESGAEMSQNAVDVAVALGVAFGVFLGLIGVALWLWMAWANGKGRSWARIVASVLYAFSILSFLASFAQPQPLLSTLLSLVSVVLGGVIVFLLWQKSSSAYYQAMSAPRLG